MEFTLAEQMVRTVAIFQGFLALPITIGCAGFALTALGTPNIYLYDFISAMFISFFAAGVIFIAWIQRTARTSRKITLYLEIEKSSLATAIWLWMILDAAFGPGPGRYYRLYPRAPIVIRAAISVIILFILYYPTLVWAFIDNRHHGVAVMASEHEEAQTEEGSREREPLLSPRI